MNFRSTTVSFLLLYCMAFSLYSAERLESTASVGAQKPKVSKAWTDEECKQFRNHCYRLPYVLWVYTLDFLLGPTHEICFGIDPQVISNLRQSNKAKIDDYGRIIANYKDNVYSWNPYGRCVIAHKSWNSYAIPKGWSFDRIEHGSVVLLNKAHDAIRVLDDVFFKEQAHYTLPKDSYFSVANRGRTLMYCTHPLIVKTPIEKLHIVRAMTSEQDSKVDYVSRTLNTPRHGVMPPITLNESGTLLAVHPSLKDEVEVIDLSDIDQRSHYEPKTIVLSDRMVDMESEDSSAASWQLMNPITHDCDQLLMVFRKGHKQAETIERLMAIDESLCAFINARKEPYKPNYFFQPKVTGKNEQASLVGDLSFVGTGSKNKPYALVSLSVRYQELDKKEVDNKEKNSHNSYTTYLINYWDITTGKVMRSLNLKSFGEQNASYAVAQSGYAILSNNREFFIASPTSDLELFTCNRKVDQINDALISPSGHWILHYCYSRVAESEQAPLVLLSPKIFYIGGEKMKKITSDEDPKVDRRKFMMRLYALQQAFEYEGEILPPRDMQKAINFKMVKPQKYVLRESSVKKDRNCIIS